MGAKPTRRRRTRPRVFGVGAEESAARLVVAIGVALHALASCGCSATVRVPLGAESGPGTMCWAPPRPRSVAPAPQARPLTSDERAMLERIYGEPSVRAAELIGAGPALVSLEQLTAQGATHERRRDALDTFDDALTAAHRDASVSVAEVLCERERVDLVLEDARAAAAQRSTFLAATATLVGAVSAVVGGGLIVVAPNDTIPQGVAGIAGGALVGGVGVLQLYQHVTVVYRTPDNALRDLWNAPARSTFYPPIVWAFFVKPSTPGAKSLRDILVQQWVDAGFVTPHPSPETALLFGDGGAYDLDSLQHRERMLRQVSALGQMLAFELDALDAAVRRREEERLARETRLAAPAHEPAPAPAPRP